MSQDHGGIRDPPRVSASELNLAPSVVAASPRNLARWTALHSRKIAGRT